MAVQLKTDKLSSINYPVTFWPVFNLILCVMCLNLFAGLKRIFSYGVLISILSLLLEQDEIEQHFRGMKPTWGKMERRGFQVSADQKSAP